MSDYPDIEKEVPAWEAILNSFVTRQADGLNRVFGNTLLNPNWLTGLAQFIDARTKPLEERIAALEEGLKKKAPTSAPAEEPTPLLPCPFCGKEDCLVVERLRDRGINLLEERREPGYRLLIIRPEDLSPAPDTTPPKPRQSSPPAPYLAERLAVKAGDYLMDNPLVAETRSYASALLPFFQEAVRLGGEEK